MEYVQGGSLQELIEICGTLTESQIACICIVLLEGLHHFHTLPNPIIHRDLKSGNVLLGIDGAIRIADFGYCTHLPVNTDVIVGTTHWMSPEVIKGKSYDCKTDVWSLGITALEMFEGDLPYSDKSDTQAAFLISTRGRPPLRHPADMSAEFTDFVEKCTTMDPAQRPSASQLLSHLFLRNACDPRELIPLVTRTAMEAKREVSVFLG